MPRYADLTNKRFGRLFVVRLHEVTENNRAYWLCWCDCGAEKAIRSDALTRGITQSCGCLGKEMRAAASEIATVTHGLTRGARGTRRPIPPEYRAWAAAIQRCTNKKLRAYKYYGGRGISFCKEWREDFMAFYKYMGPRPPGTSLDRIDVDGNYEPGNVRWADAKTQNQNRRCVISKQKHMVVE